MQDRINELKRMISEGKELLKDEMAIAILSDIGMEIVECTINRYEKELRVLEEQSKQITCYGVHRSYYKNGFVRLIIIERVSNVKPKNVKGNKPLFDYYIDYFDTLGEAQEFANSCDKVIVAND